MPDFNEFAATYMGNQRRPDVLKAAARSWKVQVVVPAVRRVELKLFAGAIAQLNQAVLIPYAELVPLVRISAAELRWAGWGKTLWRFYRAWSVARATLAFPWSVWGAHSKVVPTVLVHCPLCGGRNADLRHLLEACVATGAMRRQFGVASALPFLKWVLADDLDQEVLKSKVRYAGLCLVAAFC